MKRQKKTGRLLLATMIFAMGWLSSCSKNAATSGSSGGASIAGTPAQFYTPPGAIYDVKYTDNTVRIDLPTVQKVLRSVSSDGQIFLFDGTDPQIR